LHVSHNTKLHNLILLQVVGWGKTEKGVQSPILLEASLSYIDHSSCRNMYSNGFEPFVTVDKFCAGSEAGNKIILNMNTMKSLFF